MARKGTSEKTERELVPVTTYLPAKTVERIDVEGKDEDRRRGAMVRRLIDEALEARTEKHAIAAK